MGNCINKKPQIYQQIILDTHRNLNIENHENHETDEIDIDEMCPICFEGFNKNTIKTYCCGKKIHKKCLEESYIVTNHTCPLCRTDSMEKKTLIKFYINIQLIRIKKENGLGIIQQNELIENYQEEIINRATERVNQIMSGYQNET